MDLFRKSFFLKQSTSQRLCKKQATSSVIITKLLDEKTGAAEALVFHREIFADFLERFLKFAYLALISSPSSKSTFVRSLPKRRPAIR